MLKNENIICISSIDWDFIWQGHQEIMTAFAKNGNRVLFIDNTGIRPPNLKDIPRLRKRVINWFKATKGFRMEMHNLYVYSPIILPFPYSRIMRWLNNFLLIKPLKRWIKAMEFHSPIIWTFLPTGTALDIIDNLDTKLLVYYCIADFYELSGNPNKVIKTENELIQKSDIIFVQGESLAEKCRSLNDNVYIFPFGVNIETFGGFRYLSSMIPEDIKRIRKPIIGYVGGIHKHIDFQLLRFIALAHPDWSLVLIGPVQTDISVISGLKNIFLLGQKDFASLPKYISEFDVGIIPYQINGYTTTVFPTKLNEYHAMGKAVISTNLPEILKFNIENDNLVLVSNNYEAFTNYISLALKSADEDLVNKRKEAAKKNSWSIRIEEMNAFIEDIFEKKTETPIEWQAIFLRVYKGFRNKVFGIMITFFTVYFLLFYTPLVWIIAEPLKIAEEPKKSDCIVVFAGGVGESGQSGQGYEERVQRAVELYKNGYAKYMIFSSGYVYAFKEPLIMKALAISLGAPQEAIILEDESTNSYQNIRFTKKILDARGWNHILLVSSPYHMRRAALVFNKIAKEIKVTYVSMPNNLFYMHPYRDIFGIRIWKRISIQQMKGILHEYLGIVHYWSKGYI